MDPQQQQLHVVLFPFMFQGHLIPTLDMAKLFSSRGLKTTILITQLNSHEVTRSIESTNHLGLQIAVRLINLPEELLTDDYFSTIDELARFITNLYSLQEQLEQTLQELSPDCLVADMFFPWATDATAKFGIPRLVFHGSGLFQLCVSDNLKFYKPFKNVSSDTEPFVLPDFPHHIEYTKAQVSQVELGEGHQGFIELMTQVKESESRSFGIVVNSFKELEGDYVDYLAKVWKKRSWLIGPLLLYREKELSIDEHECLKWLDSKKPNSVMYVCFGSVVPLSDPQLHEIALGLEASGHQFIWVAKKNKEAEEWLPEGFENRIGNRGLILRGWAPQVLILKHKATGAFITHCGWNSILEAVCAAGVPMATWPIHAEQPINEKLLTQVLKLGIPVGSPRLNRAISLVKREEVADEVKRVMEGEEAVEMRSRAKALKEAAKKATGEGGSSYNELSSLIEELRTFRCSHKSQPKKTK